MKKEKSTKELEEKLEHAEVSKKGEKSVVEHFEEKVHNTHRLLFGHKTKK